MSVNEEFLDDSKSFIEWKLSFVIQMMTEKPESEDYYEYKKKVIDLFSSEILQHFQQEQERAKLEAKLEELGEIQLQHGREYTVTHINGEPQLIRDRISELNSLLFDLRRKELSNLKDKEEIE